MQFRISLFNESICKKKTKKIKKAIKCRMQNKIKNKVRMKKPQKEAVLIFNISIEAIISLYFNLYLFMPKAL